MIMNGLGGKYGEGDANELEELANWRQYNVEILADADACGMTDTQREDHQRRIEYCDARMKLLSESGCAHCGQACPRKLCGWCFSIGHRGITCDKYCKVITKSGAGI